ncbi:unnamed protein product [Adineta ricciae]|uniref:non-reducing end alpha-L-arabinofuranosidase n=1 Tax=Adineta ricciae TaxID=249248 RepID=A0A815GZQ5_ADIRI|nr:unnamed protein product [Adineta ricciae]
MYKTVVTETRFTDFVGASLVGCNFSGARLVNQNTDSIGTNLTGSIIPDEPLIRSKLYNSILPNGTWGPIPSKNLVVNGDAEQNKLIANRTYLTGWIVSFPGRIIAMLVIFYISFLATAVPGLLSAHQSNDNIVSLNIENADSGQAIPSIMHGVILETNINRGDDGGLYAELIYNRAFQENGRSLDGWLIFGQASANINTDEPLSTALPAQMRFSINAQSNNISGFRNGGFAGINVAAQNYTASFFYRPLTNSYLPGNTLSIGFSDSTGQIIYAMQTVNVSKAPINQWYYFTFIITVVNAAPTSKNFFFIQFPSGSQGDFEFNLISCFPPTFKNRPNGARNDIAQVFSDLKPGCVRLPGGDDLEGLSIPERFIWNNTIGFLENRPGRRGRWIGYNTQGFGLLELLTFTEDIGATPILAVYAGYSVDGKAVPEDQLQPYIDEVINELDFLTASADSNKMGGLRKRLGRSQPFDIRYVEIGNEDFNGYGPQTYGYRWRDFYNALSQRFPNITFIATTTTSITTPPVVDDHNYQVPLFYIENFRRYENVPRPGPKVLVGEFAVINDDDSQMDNPWGSGRISFSSMKSAVAESVYRIGFERNSDIIIAGLYAPILQNVDITQWTPNLIVFNASSVLKTTSYLAQKIFAENLGNIILHSTATNSTMTHQSVQQGQEGDGKLGNLYFIATKNTDNNTLIVKLASVDSNDTIVKTQIHGSMASATGTAYILSAGPGVDPSKVANTMDNPNAVSIVTKSISSINGTWSITIPSWSVVVVTLPL